MNGFAIILLIAAAGYGVARWARLPIIPLLIVAGSLVAALGLLPRDETVGTCW